MSIILLKNVIWNLPYEFRTPPPQKKKVKAMIAALTKLHMVLCQTQDAKKCM